MKHLLVLAVILGSTWATLDSNDRRSSGGFRHLSGGFRHPSGGFRHPSGGFRRPSGGFRHPPWGFRRPSCGTIRPTWGNETFEGRSVNKTLAVIALVDDILDYAEDGTTNEQLAKSAADVLLSTRFVARGGFRGPVATATVWDFIVKTASEYNITVSNGSDLKAFFETNTNNTERIFAALRLWGALADKASNQLASGESTRTAVQAIRLLSRFIWRWSSGSDGNITFNHDDDKDDTVAQRSVDDLINKREETSSFDGF